MKKIVVFFLCALCLAGCGKRGKLDFPEGSTYPRMYPAFRQPKPERMKAEELPADDKADEETADDISKETDETE